MSDNDPSTEERTDSDLGVIDPLVAKLIDMIEGQIADSESARREDAERQTKILFRFMVLFVLLLVVNGALFGVDLAVSTGWIDVESSPHVRSFDDEGYGTSMLDTGFEMSFEEEPPP